jgi:hypothetical protein
MAKVKVNKSTKIKLTLSESEADALKQFIYDNDGEFDGVTRSIYEGLREVL